MSYATVVSIYPHALREIKPQCTPGIVELPASIGEEPVTLVVTDAQNRVYIGDHKWIVVPIVSEEFASALVGDYISACWEVDEGSKPGLFWVAGKYSTDEVKDKFAKELEEAHNKQISWFNKIVRIADNDWNRFRNHRAISDIQRTAAKTLGIERDWTKEIKPEDIKKCPVCRTLVDPLALLCMNCKTVLNETEYAKYQNAGKGVTDSLNLS